MYSSFDSEAKTMAEAGFSTLLQAKVCIKVRSCPPATEPMPSFAEMSRSNIPEHFVDRHDGAVSVCTTVGICSAAVCLLAFVSTSLTFFTSSMGSGRCRSSWNLRRSTGTGVRETQALLSPLREGQFSPQVWLQDTLLFVPLSISCVTLA